MSDDFEEIDPEDLASENVTESGLILPADLDASGPSRNEQGEEPNKSLPLYRCELTCPTPVAVRVAEYRAENEAHAERLHRKANDLPGAIAGAMRITLVEPATTSLIPDQE